MSEFLKFLETEKTAKVIEEGRKPAHPIFLPVGRPPADFDDLKASIKTNTKTGAPKVRPFVQMMMPLGYGDVNELMELGGFPPKDLRYVREYVKQYGDTYQPPATMLASGEPMQANEDTGMAGAVNVPTDVPDTKEAPDAPQSVNTPLTPDTKDAPTSDNTPDVNVPNVPVSDSVVTNKSDNATDANALADKIAHAEAMIKSGATVAVGGKAKLDVLSSDKLALLAKRQNKGGGKRRTISKATKQKVKTLLTKNGQVGKSYFQKMNGMLSHGIERANGDKKFDLMLTGDPGVGKTTFIRQFSALTGVPLAVIEAPHIAQEHLINIPFIVATDISTEKSGNMEVTENEKTQKFDVVSAESHLATMIRATKAQKNNVARWHRKMQKVTRLYKQYSKDETLQTMVGFFRERYDCILFIDEYFRTEDKTIRNILRGILNGNIGSDKIPPRTYMVFASNMDSSDGSFDAPPANTEFEFENFDASSKADWEEWFISRYIGDRSSAIEKISTSDYEAEDEGYYKKLAKLPSVDEDFVKGLIGAIPENLFSTDDDESGVRFSPRRFEQICVGLNSLIKSLSDPDPRKRVTTAMIYSFIRTNFRHYSSGDVFDGVNDAIAGYVESHLDSLGIKSDRDKIVPASKWRDEIKMQFILKKNLGDARQYPFLIGGEPGIGKTMFAGSIAKELGMPIIEIDASTINKDDILGMPVPDDVASTEDGGKTKRVRFTKPPMYERIMLEYMANRDAENRRRAENGQDAMDDDTLYHQVLFIDEFTRVDEIAVYNSLRKVMLEKSFGGGYDLPEDIIMMGALNPQDSDEASVKPLTDHMRDVLDIVDAKPSWREFYDNYLSPKLDSGKDNKGGKQKTYSASQLQTALGFNLVDCVRTGITSIIKELKSPEDSEGMPLDNDSQEFYWGASDDTNAVYINPREIEEIYKDVISASVDALISPASVDSSFHDDVVWDANIDWDDSEKNMWKDLLASVLVLSVKKYVTMVAKKNTIMDEEAMMMAWGVRARDPQGLYQSNFESMFEKDSKQIIPYNQMMIASDFDTSKIGDLMWETLFEKQDINNTVAHFAEVFLTLSDKMKDEENGHFEFIKLIHHIVNVTIEKSKQFNSDGAFEDRLLSQLALKFKDVGADFIADVDLMKGIVLDKTMTTEVDTLLTLIGSQRLETQ